MKQTYLFAILTFLFVSLNSLNCGGKKNVKNNQNQQKKQNDAGNSDDATDGQDNADDNPVVIPNQDGDINNTCDSDTFEPNNSFAEAKELKAAQEGSIYTFNNCTPRCE